MEIRVILPEKSKDLISESLRQLTEAICKATNQEATSGLGGMYGYGADHENNIFQMKEFCWCEFESCAWCGETEAPYFHHKESGSKVWWYKWIGRGMEIKTTLSDEDWVSMVEECIESLNV